MYICRCVYACLYVCVVLCGVALMLLCRESSSVCMCHSVWQLARHRHMHPRLSRAQSPPYHRARQRAIIMVKETDNMSLVEIENSFRRVKNCFGAENKVRASKDSGLGTPELSESAPLLKDWYRFQKAHHTQFPLFLSKTCSNKLRQEWKGF